jgi:uncharacterized protein (DUF169 family)
MNDGDFMNGKTSVQQLLALTAAPIAIGFLDAPPAGIPAWGGGAVAAGCVFWSRAAAGERFYTDAGDHYNCAVGCHTHAIPLPAERAEELEETIACMVGSRYLDMNEVAGIPTLRAAPRAVAYGPADDPGFVPDVVLVRAKPAQAMLLYEAAVKAGAADALMNALGRPACAVLPLALNSEAASVSFGCVGNRVNTGLPDDEMYVCIPAEKWDVVTSALAETCDANAAMENYHASKKAQFAA